MTRLRPTSPSNRSIAIFPGHRRMQRRHSAPGIAHFSPDVAHALAPASPSWQAQQQQYPHHFQQPTSAPASPTQQKPKPVAATAAPHAAHHNVIDAVSRTRQGGNNNTTTPTTTCSRLLRICNFPFDRPSVDHIVDFLRSNERAQQQQAQQHQQPEPLVTELELAFFYVPTVAKSTSSAAAAAAQQPAASNDTDAYYPSDTAAFSTSSSSFMSNNSSGSSLHLPHTHHHHYYHDAHDSHHRHYYHDTHDDSYHSRASSLLAAATESEAAEAATFTTSPTITIGDGAIYVLRDYLKETKSLQKVTLNRCRLGETEADEVAFLAELLPAFYRQDSVTELHLSHVGSHGALRGESGGEALAKLLQNNARLKKLTSSGNALGPQGARMLRPGLRTMAHHLQELSLQHGEIGNEGLGHLTTALQRNRSLTLLNLSHNAISGAAGGARLGTLLQENKSLEILDLTGNPLGPVGAMALATPCGGTGGGSYSGITAVMMPPSTRRRMSMPSMASSPYQGQPDSGGAAAGAGFQYHHHQVSAAAASWFHHNRLGNNRHLLELHLAHCQLGNDGIIAIVDSLIPSPPSSLSKNVLSLSNHGSCHSSSSYHSDSMDNSSHSHELPKKSSRLRVLILSHNNITSQGLGALARLLENSDSIQHLGLVANKNILSHDETKTVEFCNVLATRNKSLQTLDLSYSATCQAAAHLFRALQVNDTLRVLDISDSPFYGLGQKGRLQLEQSLPLFKGLRRLSVNWNFFRDVALLQALQRNTSLHFLIARPGSDRDVQARVGLVMQRNKALTMADTLLCIKPTPQVLPPSLWTKALEKIAHGNSQASSAVYRILRERLANGM